MAGSPYAAQVGAEILAQGGNAVDAAVATAFALTVTEPGMSGLGGRTVMLVGFPDGSVAGLNGGVAWPEKWVALRKSGAKIPRPKGWGQVAVPGTLAALAEANRKWGNLPLWRLIAPSVSLARNGFVLSKRQEAWLASNAKAMSADPALRAIFLHPDGSPYSAGELLRQPDLARTLEMIAEKGPEVFYRGMIAQKIVEAMEKQGGYVTLVDLRNYRATPAEIAQIRYGPYRIASMDRPAMGRVLLWCLSIMGRLPKTYTRLEDVQAQAEILSLLPQLLHDRPLVRDYGKAVAPGPLLTEENARRVAEAIRRNIENRTTGIPRQAPPKKEYQTTHLTVSDRKGWVVSLTQTIGDFFGPKVALPGYGITFASTMGSLDDEDVSQGPFSSIAPTLVFDAGGRPLIGVGAAGGDRIPGAIFQILHNVLDRGMEITSAVNAPRIAFESDSKRNEVYLENGEEPEIRALIEGLRKRGIPAAPLPKSESVARAHALMRTPNGEWIGAPDPRWIGIAAHPVNLEVIETQRLPRPSPERRLPGKTPLAPLEPPLPAR
ncbi:MAG: gamma-glutamyltransferase [Armatimonadetes bacterium]|nr:gamma-glutamyltransferase [Armatimonadota bacterium]